MTMTPRKGGSLQFAPVPATFNPNLMAQVLRTRVEPEAPTVLARYTIPLGQNEATLVLTGSSLSADDFEALKEYVDLFKKQFERAAVGQSDPLAENMSNAARCPQGITLSAPRK